MQVLFRLAILLILIMQLPVFKTCYGVSELEKNLRRMCNKFSVCFIYPVI